TQNWFTNQLNESDPDSILSRVLALQDEVDTLLNDIPHGDTQAALASSITSWLSTNNIDLPETRELKRFALPDYDQSNDPVVLISGIKANGLHNRDETLNCRFPSQLVTGFNYNSSPIGVSDMNSQIPMITVTGLPTVTTQLIQEFFFLDPANATMVAAQALGSNSAATISDVADAMADHSNDIGTVPEIDLATWTMPWSPLYLMWEIDYFPIDFETNGSSNWDFDGEKYTWKGSRSEADTLVFTGRIFLTPQSTFNFQSQLEKYLENHPDPDLQAIEDFIESLDQWDFLSQSLDGFSSTMAGRDPLSALGPGNALVGNSRSLSELVGPNATYSPITGDSQPQRHLGWRPTAFQPLRSGQMVIRRLTVVDRFGQFMDVVTEAGSMTFHPALGEGMVPEYFVEDLETERFAELPPRLLQPARLDFNYVDADGGSDRIDLNANTNPVVSWVLPNHLDDGLTFYGPDGAALGEMLVFATSGGEETLNWTAAPGSDYDTVASLEEDFPVLYEVLNGLQTHGGTDAEAIQAYRNLIQVVDETLWAIDPLGARDDLGLSVLVGRPLALVRAELKFTLSGPAITNPSWQYTPVPQENPMLDLEFPIRLGDLLLSQDGLIGYFNDGAYDRFYSTHFPSSGEITASNPVYVEQIAPSNYPTQNFRDTTSTLLTMLIDPRAEVHAFSGLLPVTRLSLPSRFVSPGLSNMEVTFKTGPLLSVLLNPQEAQNTSIQIPRPSERNGSWSWIAWDGTGWNIEYELNPTDQSANFSNVPPVLRTGLLKLTGALESS
ncbi:MAG: hypothetical protein AAF570_06305, partial [Bacteroidota bacterium]